MRPDYNAFLADHLLHKQCKRCGKAFSTNAWKQQYCCHGCADKAILAQQKKRRERRKENRNG